MVEKGIPTIEEKKDKSFVDKVRDISLRASGIGFIIGDASMFAADRLNKDATGSMTGAIYIAGAIAAARYGKENPERQMELLGRRLREYLKKEGVEIPTGTALNAESLTKPRGIIDHIEDFFYQYPSQILNTMFGIGGTFKIASGLKKTGPERYSTMAYGGLVTTAALIGLLVPEKEPDKEHPPTSAIGKLWAKIQEAPLRTTSAIYLVNNVSLLASAFAQRKTHLSTGTKPGYYLTFLTAASYIVANSLLGFATKDSAKATKENTAHVEALENMSAEVLANVPEELRRKLIERTAGFLSGQPEVSISAQELAQAINNKVESQQMILARQSVKPANWQEKVAAATLGTTPSLS